ncbi:chromosome segregation protein Spc25-like protein [Encephalitozoon romaleae SJ-2008]|uniref:Kinetochore protein SPC25 n=1 Tax=Encephalitozoon romaleae (strain SJ-2008) TaxID=1178016 RepID=I6ZL90_ENCRO|nr:chromosome segregation protein Spc25-like protein [Encephalitozoon romaleae SJ-2008]AFN84093.1 chromosome segregation protein Spc25-like protein [Encephalitozoon romaleae SJ-2008]
MGMEHTAANAEKIRGVMDGIINDLEGYLEMFRNHARFLRGRISRDKQEGEVLLQTVTSTLNEMRERNERLVDERNALKSRIEQDTKDLKASEDEKHELMNQIRELEMNNLDLKEVFQEKKGIENAFVKKMELIFERNKQREALMEAKAEWFKRYLGMDIIPVRENVIKIVFSRICPEDSVECFVTLDLSMEDAVIDLFPRMYDLEKANGVFRECRSFHDFLAVIRKEFRREYSGI